MRLYILVILAPFAAMAVSAQNNRPATRAAAIEQERREKAQNLAKPAPNTAERVFDKAEDVIDMVFGSQSGFRPVIGGLATGQGFAAGPEYFRPDLLNGNLVFRTSARGSTRLAELLDAQATFPHLAADQAFVDLYAVYRNYPSLDYYGQGPNSSKRGACGLPARDHVVR